MGAYNSDNRKSSISSATSRLPHFWRGLTPLSAPDGSTSLYNVVIQRFNLSNHEPAATPTMRLLLGQLARRNRQSFYTMRAGKLELSLSFTTSPSLLEELATMREARHNEGSRSRTVVSPTQRLTIGLPLLDRATEMWHWGMNRDVNPESQMMERAAPVSGWKRRSEGGAGAALRNGAEECEKLPGRAVVVAGVDVACLEV
ncbi:uncharacterized protein B0I36DRAFT_166945 [Microdochium trichocladiopsis]|uniref:Uncharacterized protein n=1 Tax=Microdochium trichocladiopsis TaxID=1682393 RepID=A0A9P9BQ64_9PEZI|nr:uncharacterized protein B0I36DRAFT_166945 [Microdochium trichocladiopsis]KAH7025226.1 hypothetical protein B0I36DRAFT_166945 [Microdochium trichocladiopsis]